MYADWNFSEPPFQTTSLGANDRGDRLLVGRDNEVQAFTRLLSNPPRAITVEGAIGVGKTSLVNVAAHRSLNQHVKERKGGLFIPALEPLQLGEGQQVEDFLDDVYILLGRTLIQRAREVQGLGIRLPNTGPVNAWINSPLVQRFGGNIGPLGVQFSAQLNETPGYIRGGFRAEIRGWLESVFPTASVGGVVCLIDNLELLRTSERARALIEQLRDPLFSIGGVRWVFCGARGIVRSVAGSPRLEGYLHNPIEVNSLDDRLALEVLTSRMEAYGNPGERVYLPITNEDFVRLFEALGSNTRSALRYADTYCMTQDEKPRMSEEQKKMAFQEWLWDESRSLYLACAADVGQRAWGLFDDACERRQEFAPGDYDTFGFNSGQAMVPHVRSLEENGLIDSAIDEVDRRRRTISISPKGWLVRYARSHSAQ